MEQKYRIKYWVWINDHYGEWGRTSPTTKEACEKAAEYFKGIYEKVEIYEDDAT